MMNVNSVKSFVVRRPVSDLVTAIFFLLSALIGGYLLKPLQPAIFPVKFVRVQGAFEYVTRKEVQDRVAPFLQSGYLALNPDRIGSAIEGIPWIRTVRVKRVWPDTLVLRVDERRVFARLNYKHLISESGVAFAPANFEQFKHLPWMRGETGNSNLLFEAFQSIKEDVRPFGFEPVRFEVSDRGAWTVEMADGLIVELGRDEPKQIFRRFIRTLTLLGQDQVQSMVRVDLRYQNGYAVEWKPGTEPEWSSFVKRGGSGGEYPIQSI